MKKNILLILLISFSLLVLSGCGSDSDSKDYLYISLGASETAGVGASPITNGFSYRLADAIDNIRDDFEHLNLAIPGAEIDDIEEAELPIALEYDDPEVITIFAGPNDIVDGDLPETFSGSLSKILSDLRERFPNTLIAVALLPDFSRSQRFIDDPDPDVTTARINAFNQQITLQANNYQAVIVDLRQEPVTSEYTADDGYHPNDNGHRIIFEKFFATIENLLPVS